MQSVIQNCAPPPAAGFVPWRFLAWLLAGLAGALALGWLSVVLQRAGFAPVGLFSLLLGGVLGLLLVGLARAIGSGHRRSMLAAATLLALTMAGSQHVFEYRQTMADRAGTAERKPQAAMFRDPEAETLWWFITNSAKRPGAVTLWVVDAALILAGTLAVAYWGLRGPFCSGCNSWYRITRSAALTRTQGLELACAFGIELPADAERVQYRLVNCRSGCGPTRFELSWTVAGSETPGCRCWLTPADRRLIEERLQD